MKFSITACGVMPMAAQRALLSAAILAAAAAMHGAVQARAGDARCRPCAGGRRRASPGRGACSQGSAGLGAATGFLAPALVTKLAADYSRWVKNASGEQECHAS